MKICLIKYREVTVPDGEVVTIYQTVGVCAKTEYKIAVSGEIAGAGQTRHSHKAPRCYLEIADAIGGRHSRSASLKPAVFSNVSKTFKTTKSQAHATVEVTIRCPRVGDGHVNTVYIDDITFQ